MIRFSYFNNPTVRSMDKSKIVSVARTAYIDLSKEQFANELLVPSWLYRMYKVSKEISFEEFLESYISEVVMKLDPYEIYKKYDGKVLCCHEKDIDTCHRKVIYLWLKSYDLEVEEIG